MGDRTYTIEEIRDALSRIRSRYWRGGGWYALGYGGSTLAWNHMAYLESAGYRRVGRGRVPPGSDVIYAPTGAVNRGGPGKKMKWWVGRWYRPLAQSEEQ